MNEYEIGDIVSLTYPLRNFTVNAYEKTDNGYVYTLLNFNNNIMNFIEGIGEGALILIQRGQEVRDIHNATRENQIIADNMLNRNNGTAINVNTNTLYGNILSNNTTLSNPPSITTTNTVGTSSGAYIRTPNAIPLATRVAATTVGIDLVETRPLSRTSTGLADVGENTYESLQNSMEFSDFSDVDRGPINYGGYLDHPNSTSNEADVASEINRQILNDIRNIVSVNNPTGTNM